MGNQQQSPYQPVKRQGTNVGGSGEPASADNQSGQNLLLNNNINDSTRLSDSMSRSERLYRDEVRNILILLEHYKLQLTIVLPKVCFVVRKAQ